MKQSTEHYDIIVCGGGLAGLSSAVAAARMGMRTVLIQDRPVLGGNSSSEIRVTPHGAARFHAYARETGIISELICEDRAQNHEQFYNNGWTNSMWDLAMYDLAMRTENLTLHLNTTIISVEKSDERTISAVIGRVANAELEVTFLGKTFIDCTGDGSIAAFAGNEWRMGTEGRAEFGEPHAPDLASYETMGSSIHFRAKDMGHPVPFTAPAWAVAYEDPYFFYSHNRKPADIRAGYWWIELSTPWHTIHESETIRHELTRHTLGIWDWIKNKDPLTKELAANYALDWIGQVPGKRESRRIMGRYLMTEHDPLNRTVFSDEVAFGGWYVDLHIPGGLLAPTSDLPGSGEICGPYGIPLRILIAQDIDNLLVAGRNISATHAALGTLRVMATTAIMGQAAGTAAAIALKREIPIYDVPVRGIYDVQQSLLRQGCFLLNVRNHDSLDLALLAGVKASSEAQSYGVPVTSEEAGEWLTSTRAQWIAVSGPLERVSIYLSNRSDKAQSIEAIIVPVFHIWDYRSTEEIEPLAKAMVTLAPDHIGWVELPVHIRPDHERIQNGYIRLDLSANPEVKWHSALKPESGQPSAYGLEDGTLKSCDDGLTLSFQLDPPQPVYAASAVINGTARPYRSINMWRSDPIEDLPQWLELNWTNPVAIGQIILTFPGHLLQDLNRYPAFYRDPEMPKTYRIESKIGERWKQLLRVEGNYQRHVIHNLGEAVHVNALRIVIEETNGDAAAIIYEVRCYETIN